MADSYERYRQGWGPQTEGWQDWLGAHGQLDDLRVAQWKAALKSGFPENAPPDALPYLGSELGIPRSPADSDATYGEKLRRAWEVWPFAGSPLGVLLAMEAAGYAAGQAVLVQQERHAFSLNPLTTLEPGDRLVIHDLAGGRWTFGNGELLWNRFGILFPYLSDMPSGWASAVSPPTGGSTPSLNEVNGLIRLVQKWKRAAALFQWVKVLTSGAMWGWPPEQAWGDPGLVWGGTVVTWGPGEYA